MYPLTISRFTLTNCLGSGIAATREALLEGRSGLTRYRVEDAGGAPDFDASSASAFETCIGEVRKLANLPLPDSLRHWDCRNNRLAFHALQQDGFAEHVRLAVQRYGANRVGAFIGTSTSGIRETEQAYTRRTADGALPESHRYRETHAIFSPAEFVRTALHLRGPAAAISTACSSSAKVFASAARMMHAGLIDAAVVGGVDTLCRTTLFGFRALELTAAAPCRPFDAERAGISIAEAGAFALLERTSASPHSDEILLLGSGESSDAYHMSTPHPDGLGARLAMESALASARLDASDIDYVNLHGTGTRTNDAAEDRAIMALFGERVPCSSTKGSTGHTLGAAGAVELVIGALAIQLQIVPGGITTEHQDPDLHCHFVRSTQAGAIRRVISNSFGFGGSNCALIVGAAGTR
jgi:3-oxoacyl-[acyl-carrier-protein] synthase-1